MLPPIDVIYEDNHLLVINKPCGIATMGAEDGQPSMAGLAAEYLRRKYNKPGQAFVGVVSRIDSLVSGVLVFAKTSKAASRLSAQIREHNTTKLYVAWVDSSVPDSDTEVSLEDYVRKNDRQHRMEIASRHDALAQLARLSFRSLITLSDGQSLLLVRLITGRKHQIRLQLSSHGLPIVGDEKYGSQIHWKNAIGLHCWLNCVTHPTQANSMQFTAWPEHWHSRLGGAAYARLKSRLSEISSLKKNDEQR